MCHFAWQKAESTGEEAAKNSPLIRTAHEPIWEVFKNCCTLIALSASSFNCWQWSVGLSSIVTTLPQYLECPFTSMLQDYISWLILLMAQLWGGHHTSGTFHPGKLACAFLHIKKIYHVFLRHRKNWECLPECWVSSNHTQSQIKKQIQACKAIKAVTYQRGVETTCEFSTHRMG